MSNKETQQEDNVTDFPNAENAKDDKAQRNEKEHINDLEKEKLDLQFKHDIEKHRLKYELMENARRKKSEEFLRVMFTTGIILTALMILMFVSIRNPSIYKIDEDTLTVVNQALNATILLVIPFLLGIIGASTKILNSTVTSKLKGNLLISSGLMATFSWIGIKSGVLISIIAPHLDKGVLAPINAANSLHDFYTMALVAIVVGMFSTNFYLMVSEKVERITQQPQNKRSFDQ